MYSMGRKTEASRLLGRYERVLLFGLLRWVLVAGFCEHGYEIAGFIFAAEFWVAEKLSFSRGLWSKEALSSVNS